MMSTLGGSTETRASSATRHHHRTGRGGSRWRLAAALPALAWLVTGAGSPASAAKFYHPEGPFVAQHNCTCRINGEDVHIGEKRCLKTSNGPVTAECVMEQNVTSWRLGHDSCPQASLSTAAE